MVEDAILILRFKRGSNAALSRIYEKYRDYLLKLATALLHDVNVAEDIVHDVFLKFAQSGDKFKLRGSLKGYLRTCVVNSAYNKTKEQLSRQCTELDENYPTNAAPTTPDQWIILKEESIQVNQALAQLPFEQREVIVLHLIDNMKFREIAKLHALSIKTIQSRYYYGVDKLRALLNIEVIKCNHQNK